MTKKNPIPKNPTPAIATATLLRLMTEGSFLDMPDHGDMLTLLKAGADVQAQDAEGRSLLHLAVQMKSSLRVALLLEYGANPEQRDNQGTRIFSDALLWGANPDMRYSQTAREEHYDIIAAFLAIDIDMKTANGDGSTPHGLAVIANDTIALDMMKMEEIRRADPALKSTFKQLGLYWPTPGMLVTDETKNDFIRTCRAGDKDEILYYTMLFKDCVNWREVSTTYSGDNGLFAVLTHGVSNIDVARLLIEKGTDVNWQNAAGETAFILLTKRTTNWREDLLLLLFESGADSRLKDHKGFTAADYAEDFNWQKGEKLLRAHMRKLDAIDEMARQQKIKEHDDSLRAAQLKLAQRKKPKFK